MFRLRFFRFTAAILTAALCHAAAAMSLSRSVPPPADGSATYPPLPPPVSGWAPTLAGARVVVNDTAVSPGAVTVRAAIPAPDRCGLPATFAVSVKAPPLQAPLLHLPPQPLGTDATIAPPSIEQALAAHGLGRKAPLELVIDVSLATTAPGRPWLRRRFSVRMAIVGGHKKGRVPRFPALRCLAALQPYVSFAAVVLAVFALASYHRAQLQPHTDSSAKTMPDVAV